MSIEAMKQTLDLSTPTLREMVTRHAAVIDPRATLEDMPEALAFQIDMARALLKEFTAIQQAESEPVAWRELCRRLYVELFYCDQQMRSVTKYGKPVFTQGSTVRDVLRDAKSALESATHPAPGVPDDVVRDAKRYRWLRSLEHCNEAWCLIGSGNANSNLDAAIDAAMLAASPAQKGGE